ncbi:MAG: ArnT family glycosyltransferase [Bacteroidia bacterium]
MLHHKFFFPALLVVFWVVILLIINPIGNFPLNDDWQYARPVWYLLHYGFYSSTDSYSPILIAQVYWGALFCLPGGFSFITLRISALALSITGILVFYFLLLKLCKSRKFSFLGALLLSANPIYLAMSNSFMTDVPFLAFALLSIYFFFLSADSYNWFHIIAATLFAMIATLIRQHGVVIPLAYALALIIKNRPNPAQCLKYFIPAIITFITLWSGLVWLKYVGSELNPYNGQDMSDFLKKPADILSHAADESSLLLAYSGFFLLPLLAFTTWNSVLQMSKRRKIIVFSTIILLSPALVICCTKLLSGNNGNILNTYGIGPRTLKGMENLAYPNPGMPHLLLLLIKIISFTGAIMLLINLLKIILDIIRAFLDRNFTTSLFKQAFILLFFIGYAVLLFIPEFFFDRYLLPFIPLSIVLILAGFNENNKIRLPMYISCCIVTIAIGFLGAAMTHDYMSWNSARWQATDYLTKELKLSPEKIDGGYEFNGWEVDANFPKNPDNPKRSWWFVNDDEYVVAFKNFEGYTIIKQFPYRNLVPYEMKNIYVLHRK